MMGPFQISDAPFQGYICGLGCWFLTSSRLWTNKGTWSSESVLLDIHVTWSGLQKYLFYSLPAHPFLECFHWLSTWICASSIARTLTSLPAAVVWWSFFETSCNKLLSLLTSVSIDSPCELALFWLPVCWLQLRTVKLLPGEVLHRYQPGKIMKEILAMP